MASKTRDDFIVLAPLGKSKDYKIASKRVGSDEQYAVVATVQSDSMCSRIIAGLALLQGEVRKLEVPAQQALVEVRRSLDAERTRFQNLQDDTYKLKEQLRKVSRDLATATDEKHKAERLAESLQRANPEKV